LDEALSSIRGFVERQMRRLLIVEDDEVQRSAIGQLIGNGDVQTVAVGTGAEALAALKAEPFDCMVLDLGLPDMTGFRLIQQVRKEIGALEMPIIIYTARALTRKEETELKRLGGSLIVKDVKSPRRMAQEKNAFLP